MYSTLLLSQALHFSDICSAILFSIPGILLRLLVPRILCGGVDFNQLHCDLYLFFYSPCHESNCPWGSDRGRREWPWPLLPYASQKYWLSAFIQCNFPYGINSRPTECGRPLTACSPFRIYFAPRRSTFSWPRISWLVSDLGPMPVHSV